MRMREGLGDREATGVRGQGAGNFKFPKKNTLSYVIITVSQEKIKSILANT